MKFGTLNLRGVMTPTAFEFIPAWDLKGHEAADNYYNDSSSNDVVSDPFFLLERSLPNNK